MPQAKPRLGWPMFLPPTTYCHLAVSEEYHPTRCHYCQDRDPNELVHEFNAHLIKHRENLAMRAEAAVAYALRRGKTYAEAADAARLAIESPDCPLDTDGDGNCGHKLCPFCGERS